MRSLLAVALFALFTPMALAAEGVAESASYHFVLAKALFGEGAYQEALEHCARAVELEPADPDLRVEYARLLLQVGELESATTQASHARELDPDSLDALRITARVALTIAERGGGSVGEAIQAFEAIRTREPSDLQSMLSLAQLYMVSRQPAKAAEVLRELASVRPEHRIVDSFLVEALLRSGAIDEAETVMREILARDPYSAQTLGTLVDLLTRKEDYLAVVAVVRAAPIELREAAEIQGRLAKAYFQQGDVDGADQALQLAIRDLEAVEGELLYLKALVGTAQGRNEEAIGDLESLLLQAPDNIQLHMTLVRVLERVGRGDEAVRRLVELVSRLEVAARYPEALTVRLRAAMLRAENEDWVAVERLTSEAQDRDDGPLTRQLNILRMEALVALDRGDEALELLDEEVARGGDQMELRAKKAEMLFRMGRESEAESLVADLLGSNEVGERVRAAEIYQRVERFEQSIPVLEKVLEDEPQELEAMFRLALAYERDGRRVEAVATFRDLLGLRPDFAPALNYLGYMWAEAGENLEEAVGLVQRAVAQDPDNGAYVDSLAWAYYQLGRYEQAQMLLERASRLMPDDPTIFEHLGDVYSRVGDEERARESYEKALGLDPEDVDSVQRKIDQLR